MQTKLMAANGNAMAKLKCPRRNPNPAMLWFRFPTCLGLQVPISKKLRLWNFATAGGTGKRLKYYFPSDYSNVLLFLDAGLNRRG
jgi:hypothetical protein